MGLIFRYVGLLPGHTDHIDYLAGWDLQRSTHAAVAAGNLGDTVLMLEHPATFTAGRRTEEHERPTDGALVVDVDRGGKITWHGPGQLVGYPIVKLPEAIGVVDYVRRLEEALIRALREVGLSTGRIPGRSGVWLPADQSGPERKIAAIGIRVAQHTTMHGFALNVNCDLSDYGRIVPCGISDAGVTSIKAEIGAAPTVFDTGRMLEPHLRELLNFEPYEPSPDLVTAPDEVRVGLDL
ncbi:lipoyl(octanoyl) transferase LipB [Enemella sp. A6]|uniref:lipoyl(octanoyl) transferase LipB n=1 Tax=Enemella sp. A6 TaxID=3440152 RepID=UPI003EB72C26